jgi:hypothetical protein
LKLTKELAQEKELDYPQLHRLVFAYLLVDPPIQFLLILLVLGSATTHDGRAKLVWRNFASRFGI